MSEGLNTGTNGGRLVTCLKSKKEWDTPLISVSAFINNNNSSSLIALCSTFNLCKHCFDLISIILRQCVAVNYATKSRLSCLDLIPGLMGKRNRLSWFSHICLTTTTSHIWLNHVRFAWCCSGPSIGDRQGLQATIESKTGKGLKTPRKPHSIVLRSGIAIGTSRLPSEVVSATALVTISVWRGLCKVWAPVGMHMPDPSWYGETCSPGSLRFLVQRHLQILLLQSPQLFVRNIGIGFLKPVQSSKWNARGWISQNMLPSRRLLLYPDTGGNSETFGRCHR